MENKTISINPKLFEMNKNTKGKKSEKRKPKGIIKPNTLKRQLIQKIKSHKRERSEQHQRAGSKEDNKKDNNHDNTDNESDFNTAMKDLSNIVKNHKKTVKAPKIPTTGVPPVLQNSHSNPKSQTSSPTTSHASAVNITLPESLNNKANLTASTLSTTQPNTIITSTNGKVPPYGCLKRGVKPTYKTWKNTNKDHTNTSANTPTNKITIVDTEPMANNDDAIIDEKNVGNFTYRQKRLQEIKNKMKARENSKMNASSVRPPKKLKRTIKNVYTLGKKGKSIKVLIKNSQTRKNNQIEKNIIQQTDTKDMKLYLKNQGLITAGSSAPLDVMREIFVSSKLSGDIENKNSDILLDNYLSTGS